MFCNTNQHVNTSAVGKYRLKVQTVTNYIGSSSWFNILSLVNKSVLLDVSLRFI